MNLPAVGVIAQPLVKPIAVAAIQHGHANKRRETKNRVLLANNVMGRLLSSQAK
jgi:hypothetical protein